MSACLNEGALQAHLDGELLSDHVASCAHCSARLSELRATAASVNAMLGGLGEAGLGETAPVAIPRRGVRFWPAAIAAAVALLALISQSRHVPPKPVDYFYTLGDHVDTIQLGTVVPVSLPMSMFDASAPANVRVQAEVLLGDDGRAQAIRFVH